MKVVKAVEERGEAGSHTANEPLGLSQIYGPQAKNVQGRHELTLPGIDTAAGCEYPSLPSRLLNHPLSDKSVKQKTFTSSP